MLSLRNFLSTRCLAPILSASFTTSSCLTSRTYEAKPIPGSDEDLYPLKWAERIFDLLKKRKEGGALVKQDRKPPPLLHMVCRLKSLHGVPHYQKAILERYGLGLNVKNYNYVLVKNVPSVNIELYRVKHLVRIQPVEFPQGIPEDPNSLPHCSLRPDGRFILHPGTAAEIVNKESVVKLVESKDLVDDKNYLKTRYLRQHHNKRWARHQLFKEFFTSHYKYKLNQDGSEYRYSRHWRLDDSMQQSLAKRHNADGTLNSKTRYEPDYSTYPWRKY